jgi:hypothetical protein
MDMNMSIVLISALVLALECFFRIILPRKPKRATLELRRAAALVVHGRLGIVVIAIILLAVLPTRMIWVSLALLLLSHVALTLFAWWPQPRKQPTKFSIQMERKQDESQ